MLHLPVITAVVVNLRESIKVQSVENGEKMWRKCEKIIATAII
jgi:hypothetical protein